MSITPRWVRLNRVIRDIPKEYILDGLNNPSARQVMEKIMKESEHAK